MEEHLESVTGLAGERIVEDAYDRIAERYLRTKDAADPALLATLDELGRDLQDGSTALDLGCGAGVPATQWLARRFVVTGVDVSARQLALARRHVPSATLIKGSMTDVDFAPASFDLVVAFYSIIHVPREKQPTLLRRIYRWLKLGGAFCATWALHAAEGMEEDWEGWGAPMWWSHHDAETSRRMLREAGFSIVSANTRTSADETWLWLTARKGAARA